jgi:hypothetical protein
MELPSGSAVTNVIVFGSDARIEAPELSAVPEELRSLGIALRPPQFPPEFQRVLTDDHAPVEWLTDLGMIEALLDQ